MKNKSLYIDYLVLAIVVSIAYWQVSLSQFTIKGDAGLLSFPWKKFVNDSLRSGYFPIWNPYINLGWTQGMEPSTWYFPSWIFALFGKYRLMFLQTEIGLHLILGAIGMYQLLTLLKLNRWALIHGSLVYILSGFFVGNFQHLGWTYYACWLPWVLFYLFTLLKSPGTFVSIKLGFTAAMMVLSGYIPFTITTCIFMMVCLLVVAIQKIRKNKQTELPQIMLYLVVSALIVSLICSPAIYMLVVNMDTMYRSGKYNDQTAAFGSLVPASWINFLFPFGSTAKSTLWNGTDISMNNVFIGWLSFFFMGLAFFEKEKKKIFLCVAGVSILALALSFGQYCPPTWFVFRHLPFYEKLRFAAQFRIYFIMGAAIMVAIGTQRLFENPSPKKTYWFIASCIFLFLLIGIFNYNHAFLKYFNAIFVQEKNKYSLWQSIGFQSIIWSAIGSIMLILIYYSRSKPMATVRQLIVFNLLILLAAVQMNMFYTAVANVKVTNIDKKVSSMPEAFTPIPNQPYSGYYKPGVGLTWTNTGGLYHLPNINCYHPYDSKNYGTYEKIQNHFKNTWLVFGKEKEMNSRAEIIDTISCSTDSVLLTPYGIEFTTTPFLRADSLFIQFSATPSTHLWVNETAQKFEVQHSLILLRDVAPVTKVKISFVPTYSFGFIITGMISFLIGLIFILVIAMRSIWKKNDIATT